MFVRVGRDHRGILERGEEFEVRGKDLGGVHDGRGNSCGSGNEKLSKKGGSDTREEFCADLKSTDLEKNDQRNKGLEKRIQMRIG